MKKQILITLTIALLTTTTIASAATVCDTKTRTCSTLKDANSFDPNNLDSVLTRLNKSVKTLSSFTADIKYRHIQHVLDSEVIRTGKIYYQRDPNNPRLRIDFTSMAEGEINFTPTTQDKSNQKDSRRDTLFDGVWLTITDYKTKSIVSQQIAAPNKPIEPLDLIGKYFPILGFSTPEHLKENFSLRLVRRKTPETPIRLSMIPLPNSPYKKDYRSIGIILEAETCLPIDFSAWTSAGETMKIEFTKIKKNKPINKKIFKPKPPKNFTTSKNPL